MPELPALSLAAMPGKRRATIEAAQEAARRGFAGVFCPSFGDPTALCQALALSTETMLFGTSIANIYTRHPHDYAKTIALVHELSGGRFRFGIGVSHAPMNRHYGVEAGKPTEDMRNFVAALHEGGKREGELPPIVLATLRKKMVRLASEIADGAVWANASRRFLPESIAELTPEQREGEDFFIGNMIPTCVTDDRAAGAAKIRATLRSYVGLPNYRRYWTEAGWGDEMASVEAAVKAKDAEGVERAMTDAWLADVTLIGTPAEIREGVAAYRDAGVKTPILVPSSVWGGQLIALREIFDVFDEGGASA